MNALGEYTYKMKNAMKDTYVSSKISLMDEQKVRAAIWEAGNLLGCNQQAEACAFENCLLKIKSIFEPIIAKRKRGRNDEVIALDD